MAIKVRFTGLLAIALICTVVGVVIYTSDFGFDSITERLNITNVEQQTITATMTTTTEETDEDCREAPPHLTTPIIVNSNGDDYSTQVRGDMGVYKDPAGSRVFPHFGVNIDSQATVFNHFDVTISCWNPDVNWAAINIYLQIYGMMEPYGWAGFVVIGDADEDDIALAMTDPWTTVFGYTLEMNYYDLLGMLGATIYADGTTDCMILGAFMFIDLFSASTGDFLHGGGFVEWGMRVCNFEYCMDTSGVYYCEIEWYLIPEG